MKTRFLVMKTFQRTIRANVLYSTLDWDEGLTDMDI